jgi:catechol 2,3-dioxygenase-like lactoylglutathione lyase family enzyme
MELHRGRLIDHIGLVVKDLPASRRFYEAVLQPLGVPIGGADENDFWIDELYVSTADSPAANGRLNGLWTGPRSSQGTAKSRTMKIVGTTTAPKDIRA